MGHYHKGLTHYESMHKILIPHIDTVKKTLRECDDDPLRTLRTLRGLPAFSGANGYTCVHTVFMCLVDAALDGDYGSYRKTLVTGNMVDVISDLVEFLGVATTMNEVLMNYHILAQKNLRGPTYEMTGSLVRQLSDTEIRGVCTDEIRLPFQSIYVDLPTVSGLYVNHPTTGKHSLCGMYIAEDNWEDVRMLRVYLVGEPKGEIDGVPDDATMYYNLELTPGMLADDAFLASQARAAAANMVNSDYVNAVGWYQIYSWVLNLVLYLTWGEPGEKWMSNKEARDLWGRIQKANKGSARRKRLHERFKKLDPRNRIVIGRGVRYDRPEGHKEGTKIASTFRVAGHWKRQHYGKGNQEVKRIFIEPYWTGSGDTAIRPRTYLAK